MTYFFQATFSADRNKFSVYCVMILLWKNLNNVVTLAFVHGIIVCKLRKIVRLTKFLLIWIVLERKDRSIF